MFYKPNYCCNCGEKIERIEWRLLTNRRFCEICETDHQLDDWLKRGFPVLFMLVGLFGFGSYFQTENGPSTPATAERKLTLSSVAENEARINSIESSPKKALKNALVNESVRSAKEENRQLRRKVPVEQNSVNEQDLSPVVISKSPQKDENGTVYFCGAETKKGTPCSRKVKGGGRCWQHPGRKAVLANKDLLVGDS